MTAQSVSLQKKLSSALQRGAGLAAALLVLSAPVRSETIDLSCANTGDSSNTIRLLIDTDRQTVTETSMGAFGPHQYDPYPATVSEQFIKYSGPMAGNSDYHFEGILDRVAGTLSGTTTKPGENYFLRQNFICRRATQKF